MSWKPGASRGMPLSRCSQEWQAPSPSCPSSPLILQAPAQTSAPAEATFSAQSGQSSCLLRCPSQTLHLMSSPGRACERLIGGAVFPEPRTVTGPAGRGGPGAVRLPSGGRGGWHSVPSPGRSLGTDTQDSVPRPRAQAREGWGSCLTHSRELWKNGGQKGCLLGAKAEPPPQAASPASRGHGRAHL